MLEVLPFSFPLSETLDQKVWDYLDVGATENCVVAKLTSDWARNAVAGLASMLTTALLCDIVAAHSFLAKCISMCFEPLGAHHTVQADLEKAALSPQRHNSEV